MSSSNKDKSKEEIKTESLINELLSTEVKYVEYLRSLNEDFVLPIKKLNLKEFADNTDIGTFYLNLSDIIDTNQNLLNDLYKYCKSSSKLKTVSKVENIANLFVKYSKEFVIYSQYSNHYTFFQDLIADKIEQDSKFAKFIQKCTEKSKGSQKYNSLLIMPVQRTPRYIMLIQELLKIYSDLEPLKEALAEILKTAKHVNEAVREHEKRSKIFEIQRKFRPSISIYTRGREFLKQNEFRRIIVGSKANRTKSIILHLFSDILLLSKKISSGNFNLKETLMLSHIKVRKSTSHENAFDINTHNCVITLKASSPTERDEWFRLINDNCKNFAQSQSNQIISISSQQKCYRCSSTFSRLKNRKRICKKCKAAVCSNCSPNEIILPEFGTDKPQRICSYCEREIELTKEKLNKQDFQRNDSSLSILDVIAPRKQLFNERSKSVRSFSTTKSIRSASISVRVGGGNSLYPQNNLASGGFSKSPLNLSMEDRFHSKAKQRGPPVTIQKVLISILEGEKAFLDNLHLIQDQIVLKLLEKNDIMKESENVTTLSAFKSATQSLIDLCNRLGNELEKYISDYCAAKVSDVELVNVALIYLQYTSYFEGLKTFSTHLPQVFQIIFDSNFYENDQFFRLNHIGLIQLLDYPLNRLAILIDTLHSYTHQIHKSIGETSTTFQIINDCLKCQKNAFNVLSEVEQNFDQKNSIIIDCLKKKIGSSQNAEHYGLTSVISTSSIFSKNSKIGLIHRGKIGIQNQDTKELNQFVFLLLSDSLVSCEERENILFPIKRWYLSDISIMFDDNESKNFQINLLNGDTLVAVCTSNKECDNQIAIINEQVSKAKFNTNFGIPLTFYQNRLIKRTKGYLDSIKKKLDSVKNVRKNLQVAIRENDAEKMRRAISEATSIEELKEDRQKAVEIILQIESIEANLMESIHKVDTYAMLKAIKRADKINLKSLALGKARKLFDVLNRLKINLKMSAQQMDLDKMAKFLSEAEQAGMKLSVTEYAECKKLYSNIMALEDQARDAIACCDYDHLQAVVQDADAISQNSILIERCRSLQKRVSRIMEEEDLADSILQQNHMQALVRASEEIGYQSEVIARFKSLLEGKRSELIQQQIIAASKNSDDERLAQLSIQEKSELFDSKPNVFTFGKYERLRCRASYLEKGDNKFFDEYQPILCFQNESLHQSLTLPFSDKSEKGKAKNGKKKKHRSHHHSSDSSSKNSSSSLNNKHSILFDSDAKFLFRIIREYMGDRRLASFSDSSETSTSLSNNSKKPGNRNFKLQSKINEMLFNRVYELLENCCRFEHLRTECYCQLIKQIRLNPEPESLVKGWEIMKLCLFSFPPFPDFDNYLELFLRKHSPIYDVFVSLFHKIIYRRKQIGFEKSRKQSSNQNLLFEPPSIDKFDSIINDESIYGINEPIVIDSESFSDLVKPYDESYIQKKFRSIFDDDDLEDSSYSDDEDLPISGFEKELVSKNTDESEIEDDYTLNEDCDMNVRAGLSTDDTTVVNKRRQSNSKNDKNGDELFDDSDSDIFDKEDYSDNEELHKSKTGNKRDSPSLKSKNLSLKKRNVNKKLDYLTSSSDSDSDSE